MVGKKGITYQTREEISGLEALDELVVIEGNVAGDEHAVDGVDHTVGSQNVGLDDLGLTVEEHGVVHLVRQRRQTSLMVRITIVCVIERATWPHAHTSAAGVVGRTHDGDGDVAVEGLNSGGERGLTIGVVEVLAGSHVVLKHLNQITDYERREVSPTMCTIGDG